MEKNKRLKGRKTKKILGTILLCLIVLILCFVAYASFDTRNAGRSTSKEGPDEMSLSWMSGLSDSLMLSEVSLPGTHDSSTKNIIFHYSFQCQDTTIKEQLMNGFRFFDLRTALCTNDDGSAGLCMMHGPGHCKNEIGKNLTLREILADVYDFLEAHPSEGVVIMVSRERDADSFDETRKVLYNEIALNKDKWYLGNTIPSIGEIRGKIVLATRFYDGSFKEGVDPGLNLDSKSQGFKEIRDYFVEEQVINLAGESIWVQNFSEYNYTTKWDFFKKVLDGNYTSEKSFLINYLSTSRGYLFLPHPKVNASHLNPNLLSYPFEKGKSYGIILVDFGTKEIAEKIYLTNFLGD
ncbi:MAG: phosphatidylinositol-specific phospholipase C domain-containing protein [Lachnospiraceae bacterium]|nr:phosphatidylinositol-specific phospholipase C domain-containing protein [Lachnospiraceae bacterium]